MTTFAKKESIIFSIAAKNDTQSSSFKGRENLTLHSFLIKDKGQMKGAQCVGEEVGIDIRHFRFKRVLTLQSQKSERDRKTPVV